MQDEKNLYKLNSLPVVPEINCSNDPILILTHLYYIVLVLETEQEMSQFINQQIL